MLTQVAGFFFSDKFCCSGQKEWEVKLFCFSSVNLTTFVKTLGKFSDFFFSYYKIGTKKRKKKKKKPLCWTPHHMIVH
jgi:hypothetical protein